MTLATRLVPQYNLCLPAENQNKTSSPEKSSPQSLINNAWFTLLRVICVIQIMSDLQLNTSTNILSNINTLRLENIFLQPMGIVKRPQRKPILHSKKVPRKIQLSCLRDAFRQGVKSQLTRRLIPFAQNSLFKKNIPSCIVFSVFKHFFIIYSLT